MAVKIKTVVYETDKENFDQGKVVKAIGDETGPMVPVSSAGLKTIVSALKNKKVADDTPVVVGSDGKKLHIIAYKDATKKKELKKAVLIEDWVAATSKGGSDVHSLDNADKTIRESALSMAAAKGTTVKTSGKLVKMGDRDQIILLAHGTPMDEDTPSKTHATEFADKKPADITKWLIDAGLQPDFAGTVYLDGCYTASGTGGGANFAKAVYDGLVGAGYEYLQVKGNIGSAITLDSGDEWSFPIENDAFDNIWDEHPEINTFDELEALQNSFRETAKNLETTIKTAEEPGKTEMTQRLAELRTKIDGLGFRNIVGTFGPEKRKK